MARKSDTYRGNRKREAKKRKLIWREFPLQKVGRLRARIMRVLPPQLSISDGAP